MRVLALTAHEEGPYVEALLDAGASGYPLSSHFGLSLALSAGLVLPISLSRNIGAGLLPYELPDALGLVLYVLASFVGSTVASLIVTGLAEGRAGIGRLLRRAAHWRVGPQWYAVAPSVGPTRTKEDVARHIAQTIPPLDDATILCLQAGNVNTGACDPARELCARAHDVGAWVHVDGAFGLWASASPRYAALADGYAEADSWAIDAHKYLNVPYDSGLLFCRHPEHLRGAMMAGAAYLQASDQREPAHYGPELSRRARGVELWAALYALGRTGVADLVERICRHAQRLAKGMSAAGYTVLNDVVLNQQDRSPALVTAPGRSPDRHPGMSRCPKYGGTDEADAMAPGEC